MIEKKKSSLYREQFQAQSQSNNPLKRKKAVNLQLFLNGKDLYLENQSKIAKPPPRANIFRICYQLFRDFRGTNHPIQYDNSFGFSQRWEQNRKWSSQQNKNLLLSAPKIAQLLSAIIFLHRVSLIFMLSIYRLYELHEQISIVSTFCIIFIIFDAFLKCYLQKYVQIKKYQDQLQSPSQLILHYCQFFFIDALFILHLSLINFAQSLNLHWFVIDLVVIGFHYRRALQIYNSLSMIFMSNRHASYIHLLGFIGKLLSFLHLFAVINYSLTKLDPTNNWLQNSGKQSEKWHIQYVYSLYFTSTTMFTVGYGDIVPQNAIQMIVTIVIQIVGVVLIGYIVSEIGQILLIIKERRERLEKNLISCVKICNDYQLNQDLQQKLKNYIINNEIANEDVNLKEQNELLLKLNDSLRNEINFENQLRVLKHSIFFISHWTAKILRSLSKKLGKTHFSPNQRVNNYKKIYIVTNGKLQIYVQSRSNHKIFYQKHLKTIKTDAKKQIYDNTYGVTSFYTQKPSKLIAISNDFTVCYTADFADLYQIIQENQRNFEEYHQLKDKLKLQKHPQTFQISNFVSIRHQYYPLSSYILKKYKSIVNQSNARKFIIRTKLKIKRQKLLNLHHFDDTQEISSNCSEQQIIHHKRLKKHQIMQINNTKPIISYRSYHKKHQIKDRSQFKYTKMGRFGNKAFQFQNFQQEQPYKNYFPKGNLQKVLQNVRFLRSKIRRDEDQHQKQDLAIRGLTQIIKIFNSKILSKQYDQK